MKGRKHKPEQIIAKLREAEAELNAGQTLGQVVQKLGGSEQTYHRWRNQDGGVKAEGGKRVSPSRRRRGVRHAEATWNVSQRQACRVLGQPRRTQRYEPRRRDDEGLLTKRLLELVRAHPRYGYRRVWALLRQEGWRVNRKRVWRLWRREGLKVPQKRH